MSWKIVVEHGNLSFSAAHFITLEGVCEPLHGHNYGVHAELTGTDLTADSYLLDFGVVKTILRALIAEMNHHFLLPLRNPYMQVQRDGTEWEIRLQDGARFVMPTSSVVALEVDNVTAERLAELFTQRLAAELRQRGIANVTTITIGIAETAMQRAYHTLHVSS